MAGPENNQAADDNSTPPVDPATEPSPQAPTEAVPGPADEPLAAAPPAPEPPARPDEQAEPTESAEPAAPAKKRWPPDWNKAGKRTLIWLGIGVAVVALYLILASFLPRWWAQRMGDLVGGSFALGVWWGLFLGALFTAIPIMIAWLTLRREMPWKLRLIIIGVAVLLAAPNLLTLSVVAGGRAAAHAGERILDVEAPAFRGATLAGALIGAAIAVGLMLLLTAYRRRGRKIKELETKR